MIDGESGEMSIREGGLEGREKKGRACTNGYKFLPLALGGSEKKKSASKTRLSSK